MYILYKLLIPYKRLIQKYFAFLPDLSNCKLINFPDGVFKILKSVIENIHTVTLADNVMKVISSKFFGSFTHLQGTCLCSFEWLNIYIF